MRSSSTISNQKTSFWEDAFIYLIYLYAVALPLRLNLKTGILFLLLGWFLVQIIRNRNLDFSILKTHSFKAILGYISLCVFSLLYSENLSGSLRFILLQSTLLLFPLIIYRRLSVKQVQNALLLFSLSCFFLSIYATTITALEYVKKIPEQFHSFSTLDWTFFSYFIPQNISFHAPYFSLYISVCLLIHTYFLYTAKVTEKKITYLAHLFFWLFYITFLSLLSSRTALVATILVLAIIAVYLTWKARKYLLLLSVVAVTAGVSWFIFQNVPYLKTKFTQGAGVLQRKMMWLSAIELIKESPVIGVAPGDSEEALVVSYREKYFMEGVTSRFDAHNQYLMAGVSLGLAGLMALLFIFYFLFKEAYNQKNFILLSFLAVFALCCLTESLLQRRDGTLLFSFITSLLLFAPKGQKTNSYLEPVA